MIWFLFGLALGVVLALAFSSRLHSTAAQPVDPVQEAATELETLKNSLNNLGQVFNQHAEFLRFESMRIGDEMSRACATAYEDAARNIEYLVKN